MRTPQASGQSCGHAAWTTFFMTRSIIECCARISEAAKRKRAALRGPPVKSFTSSCDLFRLGLRKLHNRRPRHQRSIGDRVQEEQAARYQRDLSAGLQGAQAGCVYEQRSVACINRERSAAQRVADQPVVLHLEAAGGAGA